MIDAPTLGTGNLAPVSPGILFGAITLPDGQTYPASMGTRTIDAHGVSHALLVVGFERCALMLIPPGIDPPEPEYWHGHIWIGGYEYRVRIDPGSWVVRLMDEHQRVPFTD